MFFRIQRNLANFQLRKPIIATVFQNFTDFAQNLKNSRDIENLKITCLKRSQYSGYIKILKIWISRGPWKMMRGSCRLSLAAHPNQLHPRVPFWLFFKKRWLWSPLEDYLIVYFSVQLAGRRQRWFVQTGSVPVDNRRSLLSSEMLRFEAFLLFGISRLLHRPFLLFNLFVDAIALAVRAAGSAVHCKSAQLPKTIRLPQQRIF